MNRVNPQVVKERNTKKRNHHFIYEKLRAHKKEVTKQRKIKRRNGVYR